jgi:hypothetical protein
VRTGNEWRGYLGGTIVQAPNPGTFGHTVLGAHPRPRGGTHRTVVSCRPAAASICIIAAVFEHGAHRPATSPTGAGPPPGYVAFATHYGFQPDFCEAADPESKGVVEALVG